MLHPELPARAKPRLLAQYARRVHTLQCTTCVEPPHAGAFCPPATTPEPRCEGARGFCDDQTAVACESGYRVAETRCGDSKVCVAPELHEPIMLNDRAALCALAADPDPACPDQQGYNQLCVGDAIVDCESRFRLQSYDCLAPSHCVWPDGGAPTCE